MLIIDRTQRTWATLSAVVCVVAGAAYFAYANWSPNGPSGGSVPGLIFGLIAAAMMVFAGLLAARRRFPAARIGSAQFWMKGHLWIGTLTVPFALFHAGFGLGGRVEILLWILFFTVILSGFWGLFLQQLLPRMMFENLPRETFIEQIPQLCNRFTAESDCQLAELCGPLEVSLTPVEMKRFETHWQPFFEEDRKKNRTEYPKTASDAAHFEKFLTKIYAGRTVSSAASAGETPVAAATVSPPTMKSVAQIKPPEAVAPAPVAAGTAEVKPKPDPKALLAAAKAKAAAAAPVAATSDAPASESAPAAPAASGKPDPRAMLAAAKAKKAAETAAPGSDAASSPATPAVVGEAAPAKPDPKALLAAARAKKAAAEAAAAPDAPAAPAEAPIEATPAAGAEPSAAPAKPDPKAILAAARAKKAAAEAGAQQPELAAQEAAAPAAEVAPTAVPAKPDPKAMLAAAKAKKALETAAATPVEGAVAAASPASVEASSAPSKPDPKAMLAAAKAKRDAAAAGGAPGAPATETAAAPAGATAPAPAGKPDPKAMMAALKAKKEAAAQQADGPVAPAAPKANPLAQLKAVKQPPADAPADLVAAAKVAPPSPTQIKELKLFYLELIRPQLPLQPATQSWREAIRRSIMACRIRSDNQHPQFTRIFDYLLDLCEQRRQFAMIQRYHFWLHGWLLVHIPVTVALYVVLAVHAVVALRVVPFGN